jgi:DNA-binding MarR family transcriptional regulator
VDLNKTLGPWLGKTSKMIGCLINEVLITNNIDLTREQWVILIKLHQKGGLAQNQLAFITERDKTSLTRLINTMERKGLVIRKKAETDKRVKLVFMTKMGKTVLTNAMPIMQSIIQNLQKGLDQKEIESAILILQKVQKNLTNFSANCGNNHLSNS